MTSQLKYLKTDFQAIKLEQKRNDEKIRWDIVKTEKKVTDEVKGLFEAELQLS